VQPRRALNFLIVGPTKHCVRSGTPVAALCAPDALNAQAEAMFSEDTRRRNENEYEQ